MDEFPASQLAEKVQFTTSGKLRKDPVDLEKCKLMEIVQYSCDVSDRRDPKAVIVCEPIVRLFRRSETFPH